MASDINSTISTERAKLARTRSPLQQDITAGQEAATTASDARQRRLDQLGDASGSPNVRGPQAGRKGAR